MGKKQPWYERNLFWGASSLATGITLAVVGAMKHDLRWLLFVAWLPSIVAAWSVGKAFPRRKYLITVLGALMTGGTLLSLHHWLGPEMVTVEPRHVVFDSSEGRENFLFTIHNRAENDLYSVQLKLRLSAGSLFDDFLYDIAATSRKPIVDGSGFADIAALRCVDSAGRSLAVFWVYRLEAGGQREITVTDMKKSGASIDAVPSYYTRVPQPRLDDPTKVKQVFHADEPMSCDAALGFWLDPSRPPRGVGLTSAVKKPGTRASLSPAFPLLAPVLH